MLQLLSLAFCSTVTTRPVTFAVALALALVVAAGAIALRFGSEPHVASGAGGSSAVPDPDRQVLGRPSMPAPVHPPMPADGAATVSPSFPKVWNEVRRPAESRDSRRHARRSPDLKLWVWTAHEASSDFINVALAQSWDEAYAIARESDDRRASATGWPWLIDPFAVTKLAYGDKAYRLILQECPRTPRVPKGMGVQVIGDVGELE